ncbi:MAG: FecR family protein [Pseudobacter sp.]|uniref:FecR family protein n=1 Tax=Pseudobacter sp. TaxID=2045420 RepID=UPI003F7F7D2D
MEKEQFAELYQSFLEDRIGPAELEQFRELSGQQPYEQWLDVLLDQTVTLQFTEQDANEIDLSRMRSHLLENVVGIKPKRTPVKYYYAAAASLLVLLAAAFYIWLTPGKTEQTAGNEPSPVQQILPAKDIATLTLADGTTLLLDSAGLSKLKNSANLPVTTDADGSLVYHAGKQAGNSIAMNTLSTPRGGQFRITLPDGSRLWLNAASSVTFPTSFNAQNRNIKLTGEAYLEVSSNQRQPFSVELHNSSIDVLGTSFNVQAYADDKNITTTLLEGSIRMNSVVMRPGQQAILSNEATDKTPEVLNGADLQKVMAWKNGFFNFDNVPLKDVMKQVERWYDIDVIYEGAPPAVVFKGGMDRGVQLSGIIRFLQNFGITATMNGRKMIISKK